MQLVVTPRRMQQLLHSNEFLKYQKIVPKLLLTPKIKVQCLEFIEKYLLMPNAWDTMVFCDEKRFNLDGPDGMHYYWHDLRNNMPLAYSRAFKGGSIIVWGAISKYRTFPLMVMPQSSSAQTYVEILNSTFCTSPPPNLPTPFSLLQDIAKIPKAFLTLIFLESKKIELFPFPAYSPDLNPIENLWGILSRNIYDENKQYNFIEELEKAIFF